jgi:hypothetical protein
VTRPRGLRRRTKVLLGAAALVTGVAAFAAYLYVHYVDVVRYSATQAPDLLIGDVREFSRQSR